MWRPRMGVLIAPCGSQRLMLNSCTLDAKLCLTTCTYTGIMRYATIVLTFSSMQQRVTVELKKWGGGLPELGLTKC
jgi:hypothetical protein